MVQNNNIVVYALWPAGGPLQGLPVGQTYHLPPFTLVGELSHRRTDRCLITAPKLAMGIPPTPQPSSLPNTCVGRMQSKI